MIVFHCFPFFNFKLKLIKKKFESFAKLLVFIIQCIVQKNLQTYIVFFFVVQYETNTFIRLGMFILYFLGSPKIKQF